MASDPPIPVLTQALAHRIERAAIAFGRHWLAGVEGLRLGDFGDHLLVGCHPDRPDLDFQNRVNGLTAADAPQIAEIGRFYDAHHVRPWWEIVPDDDFGAISAALTARGAAQIGFHGVLYGVPPSTGRAPDGPATVRTVDGDDESAFATYCEARVHGHDLPTEVHDRAARDLAGWRRAPATTLYLAVVDDQPAGTAALTVHEGVGYLADAATLPAFRGRGIQSQLIARRLADAAGAGCEVVASQATFAGGSHRNLQRAGLTGGFTKVVWR